MLFAIDMIIPVCEREFNGAVQKPLLVGALCPAFAFQVGIKPLWPRVTSVGKPIRSGKDSEGTYQVRALTWSPFWNCWLVLRIVVVGARDDSADDAAPRGTAAQALQLGVGEFVAELLGECQDLRG